ncbi:lipase family protein [Deinococcus maricopensis]|uniref:Lipase class 3 n=1 Tax=Deinococcus maricopensis (strain DSM 21211 / LMG 22137 / NRRL B-23946 / LB-34) TaxID=709986 RepID=E8U9B9_DEIML|nr:Mbeg1-like protein [Deinococcus maricopensis]ADV67658.1 lipase class 3 [Deinococcus maricopensis DSM 21211]
MTFDEKRSATAATPGHLPHLPVPAKPVAQADATRVQVRAPAPTLNPNGPADDAARALHRVVEQQTRQTPTTGSPATLLLGVEAAASMRLGSTRHLVHDEGWLSGPKYASLDGAEGALGGMLRQLKTAGRLDGALKAYARLYGKQFTAVLGERVRDVNVRQRLLKLLPPLIPAEQLTMDSFLEQLSVGYVYLNDTAEQLQGKSSDGRRGSSPKNVLETFGYRAGAPVSGKWGFQMRVFYPIPGKAKWPNPIVAFRGTEGISFDIKGKPEGTTDTVIGDMSPKGVGYNQYDPNRALIQRNMDAAAKHGDLIITGHSLGGALAQIAAVEYRAQTRAVVTFQSPGIDEDDTALVEAYNRAHPTDPLLSRHYRIDGDAVPTAGEEHLPGQIYYFDRVQRARGSTAPFKSELSYDSADLTRATAGHVIPMLSTYVRGMGVTQGLLGEIARDGLRDENSLGDDAKDVQVVFGGQYGTAQDPRLQLEKKRTTTAVKGMDMISAYTDVYYDQIAYNTLLATVERRVPRYASAQAFMAAMRTYLDGFAEGQQRLPLTANDRALGQQLQLPMFTRDYAHPIPTGMGMPTYPMMDSKWADMQEQGVTISQAAALRVAAELGRIWTAWHPEGAK